MLIKRIFGKRQAQPVSLAALIWVYGALSLSSLPHLLRLPLWIMALVVGVALLPILGRRLLSSRMLSLGRRRVIALVCLVVGTAVIATTTGWTLVDGILAFLIIAAWLKLLEYAGPRDIQVVLLTSLVLLGLSFVFDQSVLSAVNLFVTLICCFATLIALNAQGAGMSPFGAIRHAARPILLALPFVAVLFALFPRVSGSLFDLGLVLGVPLIFNANIMAESPPIPNALPYGEIARRSTSRERVMLSSFLTGKLASRLRMYWRGPVYWRYDGTHWHVREGWDSRRVRMTRQFSREAFHKSLKNTDELTAYTMKVLPHGGYWLYALEAPYAPVPSSFLSRDLQLINLNPIRETLTYHATAYLTYDVGLDLHPEDRALGLQLPDDLDPRIAALAEKLGEDAGDNRAYANAVLALLSPDGGYRYLARAVPSGQEETLSEFLFESKIGYAGHFSGAVVVLLRQAGIPARLVAGYRGGLSIGLTNSVITSQSDAHAWAEVWLEGRGWVRMDPSMSYIRVHDEDKSSNKEEDDDEVVQIPEDPKEQDEAQPEQNESNADEQDEPAEDEVDSEALDEEPLSAADIAAMLDGVWQSWIVDFSAAEQIKITTALDIERPNWRDLLSFTGMAVGALLAAYLMVIGLLAGVRRYRASRTGDPAMQYYAIFCKKLKAVGIERAAYEGHADFANWAVLQLGKSHPSVHKIRSITTMYEDLRYGKLSDDGASEFRREALARLRTQVRQFSCE